MDDLISKQAAIDAIVSQSIYGTREAIAEAVRNDYKKSNEWLGGIDDAISTIEEMNAIHTVPLDKLCNTLSGLYEVLPCWECEKVLGEEYCQEKECGCGSIDHWKSYFEKKMEGLDAAD